MSPNRTGNHSGQPPKLRSRELLWAATLAATLGQLTMAAVTAAPTPIVPLDRLSQLTPHGKCLYRPELELPFYFAAISVSMLLCGLGSRLAARPTGAFSAAADIAAPAAFICAIGSLITAVAVACFQKEPLVTYKLLPLAFCIGPAATLMLTATICVLWSTGDCADWAVRAWGGIRPFLSTIVIPAGIFAWLYVPDVGSVLKSDCIRLIHHWDFFAYSPMWSYLSGKALVVGAYAQYGVGWPLFFAWLSAFVPVDYAFGMRTAVIVDCIYFNSLYFFIRHWLRSTCAALCCSVLAIGLQIHCSEGFGSHLVFPSSTAMRYFGDVFFFWICVMHARLRRQAWIWAMGAVAGVQSLLAVDTAVWMNVGLLAYLLLAHLSDAGRDGRWPAALGMVARAFGVETIVVAAGYLVATRGQLLSAGGISECVAALKLYSSGFSAIPLRELPGWALAAMAVTICIYLSAFASGVAAARARRASATALVAAAVGIYGTGILSIAINRSVWPNLFHASVPAAILLTAFVHKEGAAVWRALCREFSAGSDERALWPARMAAVVWSCAIISLVCGAAEYPGVARYALRRWSGRPVVTMTARQQEEWEDAVRRKDAICAVASKFMGRGQRVAIIADVETWCMRECRIPAVFRFAPCSSMLFSREFVANAVHDIEEAGVGVVIVHEGPARDTADGVESDGPEPEGLKSDTIPMALTLPGFVRETGGHGLSVYVRHAPAVTRHTTADVIGTPSLDGQTNRKRYAID
jgi:hypothetical protein